MKKFGINTIIGIFCFVILVDRLSAQEFPFQDISLSDEERLDNLISLMTLDEKIQHLSPFLRGIPRLGLKGTRTVEGLHGLAWSGPANWSVKGEYAAPTTTFPQAIGLAETWDPELLKEIASWEADEARYLAQNQNFGRAGLIVFAPNADLGRDIRWGRTEECYGEDAYLAGQLTVAYVSGLQGDHPRYWKTASLMKHFLANSNENNRFINSSDFDEQLFYEYYAYAFYKGIVKGGSRAYMAAYNKYNGIPCTVHPVLKEVTVEEWGQNGIICTDGGGFSQIVSEHKYYPDLTVAAAACMKAGINMFLDRYNEPLRDALDKELITEKDLDQAILGPLRVMLKLGMMDNGPENPYAIPWSKENIPSIVHITQSSQELGNGLADVIFGDVSPAGRLVQTWSASIDELLPILDYNIRNGRTYMYDQHEPLFAFGHGLSYTTFEYSDLQTGKASIQDGEIMDVSLKVTNTGSINSDEVIQLYVRFPDSEVDKPAKALKGFQRVYIPAGETKVVTIHLKAEDLKYWDVDEHAYILEKGNVELMVGASSADTRLNGMIMAE